MRDFTLPAYQQYLKAIKESYGETVTFGEFFRQREAGTAPTRFCILRHDVDRRPGNVTPMAEVERALGLTASYFCRNRRRLRQPALLTGLARLGHEVGYHYECLSDANGDLDRAYADFTENLRRFREQVRVDVVAMHGRALNAHDNRDMWRSATAQRRLREEHGILGEVYVSIDYTDILYLTDTGRNWEPGRSNRRDRTNSQVSAPIESREDLLRYLSDRPHPRLILQTHPERWSHSAAGLLLDGGRDRLINLAKKLV